MNPVLMIEYTVINTWCRTRNQAPPDTLADFLSETFSACVIMVGKTLSQMVHGL